MTDVDAVVVGAGPNGLAAALTMAEAGWRVLVLEAGATPGGGCRSAELTLPGFVHDVCSAIHPLMLGSPAMRDLNLEAEGLRWIHPPAPFGQPVDEHRAAVVHRSVEETAAGLGRDGDAWRRLYGRSVEDGTDVIASLLAPLDIPPRHP
ncbi:MAG TPA: FAD-dependent oxidoreductase, partial [Acidimicrobiales bacterium]